jgi:hypothetical protein
VTPSKDLTFDRRQMTGSVRTSKGLRVPAGRFVWRVVVVIGAASVLLEVGLSTPVSAAVAAPSSVSAMVTIPETKSAQGTPVLVFTPTAVAPQTPLPSATARFTPSAMMGMPTGGASLTATGPDGGPTATLPQGGVLGTLPTATALPQPIAVGATAGSNPRTIATEIVLPSVTATQEVSPMPTATQLAALAVALTLSVTPTATATVNVTPTVTAMVMITPMVTIIPTPGRIAHVTAIEPASTLNDQPRRIAIVGDGFVDVFWVAPSGGS